MNQIRNWFHTIGAKMAGGLSRFMAGRYGTDRLNTAILLCSLVLCIVSMFFRNVTVNLILSTGAYGLLIWSLFRSLSRNTYQRYRENRSFLLFFDRLKDREHRYFTCPKCRQPVRVPRGKGKIAIHCPKCGERFIKKT